MSSSIFGQAYRRRSVLKSLAAVGTLPFITPLASSTALASGNKYAGRTINLLIIQPHVVTGKKIAEDFERLTGAKVNVTAVPYDQVSVKATLDVQSGANQFDIIDYFYTYKGQLAEDGVIEDVTDLIERDKAEIQPEDFIQTIYDQYTLHDGRRYGLPYDGDSHLLFYNRELFDRYGLKAPSTWDEYNENAKVITEAEAKNGIYGAAVLGAKIPVIILSTYANRLTGFGGNFLKADGTSALDSTEAVEALKSLLASAPHALPTPLETRFEEGLPAFLNGKAAQIDFWTDLGGYAQDPKGSKIVDKWGVARIPTGGSNKTPRLAFNAGFGFAITSGSKNKDVAWDLIKLATSKDYHEQLLALTGSGIDPDRQSGLKSEKFKAFQPLVQPLLDDGALENSLAWPTAVYAPKLENALTDELALALAGSKSAEQAIADAHQAWTEIIETNG
ncbi:sugar ABC transporter substrate-binding protein [Ensifer adhaerens]|uniref:ABC transporter substrate-binding protein n=1 Tax=Ensifer adhaerens TaxID=106592 RepID=UPI001CBB1650|nr:sugar ABC transporter substrate-binding protein [Ensifer adhaerens]MBZ7924590.1 sugar ABC transporter substrate-binding protein [Ensifer adhaerens]UAX96175.1 sugar ABC transporter substrate-binding protein [Ensifer adhaerens]UAY04482.1 sugar ABC transporter substrate-binding protein [Ensifer adhaerens]UAY09914.1 sugar ABC transporter substrate-binding protein [Ensifer adhaerens]